MKYFIFGKASVRLRYKDVGKEKSPVFIMNRRKDLEEQRDDTVREIIRAEALAGEWLPIPEEFHSGDEMGFDVAGVKVRASVTFDRYEVKVNMTSPVQNSTFKEIYFRQQTFFRRNPPGASLFVNGVEGGPAIPKCVDAARDLLIGLYTDWKLVQSRKESIRRKFSNFLDFSARFRASEKRRIVSIRKKLAILSAESGELKSRFKDGEMSQSEYVGKKGPIHKEIVSLMDCLPEKDPFVEMFSEELTFCKYADDKKTMIESVGQL